MPVLSHLDAIRLFIPVGSIDAGIDRGGPYAEASISDEPGKPGVYLWIAERRGSLANKRILYVGKAGKTIKIRHRQHNAGFKTSIPGKGHALFLANLAEQGWSLWIYGLWPDPFPFAGEMIPAHASVEEWLINAIRPTPERNRAGVIARS